MRAFFLIPALLLLASFPSQQANLPEKAAGETLQYRAEWRLFHAGDATLQWSLSPDAAQARLQIKSAGRVSMLFSVDDLYMAQMGADLCAASTSLTAHEGSRSRETRVTYDAARRKAEYVERDLKRNTNIATREIDIPSCTHEIIGGLYRLRSLRLPVGKSPELALSDGKKSVMARVEAQQQETVETPAGKFKTIRYEAFLFNNVLYRRSGRLYIWLTDDDRRLPVQIRARMQFHIGTITLQLVKAEAS